MVGNLLQLAGTDLPLFSERKDAYTILFSPGQVVVCNHEDTPAIEAALIDGKIDTLPSPLREKALLLRQHAMDADEAFRIMGQQPYQPECLTLYLSERCQLTCTYCFAASGPVGGPILDLAMVIPAAQLVAAVCQRKELPLTLVIHGGGEPTFHPGLLETVLGAVTVIADGAGLPLFRYIATNGVFSEDRAHWLADNFDLVGLSVDGPPAIQDYQRPLAGGGGSGALVERTASILREEGVRVAVRTTITPRSMSLQATIARYLCEAIDPESIAFEPVYCGGRAGDDLQFIAGDVPEFLEAFRSAQSIASEYDIPLTLSGTREGSIHQAYCHLFRNVLNLTPDGGATICFKSTGGRGESSERVCIGYASEGAISFDQRRIDALRVSLSTIPAGCSSCFNRFSCVKSCPDRCLLDVTVPTIETPFRCALLKALAYEQITAEAESLWRQLGA